MTLAGKRVVVIGASSGIGRGVAEHAVAAGASVVAAARRVEKLAEIEGAIPLALDLRDPASREAFAAGVAERLGSIDLLFVSSGSAPLRSLVASDDADWLSALETNLIGVNRTLATCRSHGCRSMRQSNCSTAPVMQTSLPGFRTHPTATLSF